MERAKPDTQPKTTIEDRPDSKHKKPKVPLKRYGLKLKVAADKKPAEKPNAPNAILARPTTAPAPKISEPVRPGSARGPAKRADYTTPRPKPAL
jgi:hypothetical protein